MLLNANAVIDAVYRSDWGRIVATLIHHFNDFDVAEEAAQEAFAAAVNQWRDEGVPESPVAWIIQTARHKAIDRIRRRTVGVCRRAGRVDRPANCVDRRANCVCRRAN